MSDFRTVVTPNFHNAKIDLGHTLLTIGSCFSDTIGQILSAYKIKTYSNPFGVLYNPSSIHKVLQYAIHNKVVPDHTFVEHGHIHLNYDFHSQFSSIHRPELASRLSDTIKNSHYFLKDAQWLIITYGTAWLYERTDTGEIVANCHKMPSAAFTKRLLTAEKTCESFEGFYKDLKVFNSNIRIILTVSPVRHIKDTLELNSVSKATLRLACHTLARDFDDVAYFPSYEIMLDDLRDYRFYKADMLHPSEEAEKYIWKKFLACYASKELKKFTLAWREILAALAHRPFHPASVAHQNFLKDTLKRLEGLKHLVNIEKETTLLRNALLNND